MGRSRYAAALLVVFFLAGGALRWVAERGAIGLSVPAREVSWSPRYLRLVALSFRPLVADMVWIRFIQDLPLSPADPDVGRKLGEELEAVTELDPAFRPAYVHGPVMLSVLGSQHCTALSIAERGIERYPDDWRISFNAGYLCFAEIGDFDCAAKQMRRAASIPGSPRWLPGLVARLMAHSEQRAAAVDYLQQQLANPSLTDERIRTRLTERLSDAIFSRDAEIYEKGVRAWRIAHGGALPPSLEAVADAGLAPPLPASDPYGGRYRLGRDGRVVSSTGNQGLVVFRRDTAFIGSLGEKLFDVRVVGRLPALLDGDPPFLRDRLDLLTNLVEAAKDAHAAEGWTDDPDRVRDLRVVEARIMIRVDLDRMKRAQLDLLRLHPGALPTLDEIETLAGVHPVDPFGTPYVLDEDGHPAPGPSREPMVALDEPGASPCR